MIAGRGARSGRESVTFNDTDVVTAVKLSIAEAIGQRRFEVWFRSVTIDVNKTDVRLSTDNEFSLDWLRSNFRSEIHDACQAVIGEHCLVHFVVSDRQVSESPKPAAVSTAPENDTSGVAVSANRTPSDPSSADRQLNSTSATPSSTGSQRKFKRLTEFVAGESNRVAISSAQHVTNHLGSISPLFLYGTPGVGKSHLAEGVWSVARRRPERLRTVFLSAEQFTSYFLAALNGSGLPNFRHRYRHVDLLVIDDVQFFLGKRATIVELQHTVDAVIREGGQLVLTADRTPGDLNGLGTEMVNRLTGGLVIRVEPPDYAARKQIVQQFAMSLGATLPDDVVELIATHITDDVRQLHGALYRLHAVSGAWQRTVDAAFTRRVLDDIFRASVRTLRLSDIEDAVCKAFEVTPKHLRSASRARKVSHPRMLAMALARKHTRSGLSEIGEYFGRRSHATVISATKKIDQWKANDGQVRMADQECPIGDVIQSIERRLLG